MLDKGLAKVHSSFAVAVCAALISLSSAAMAEADPRAAIAERLPGVSAEDVRDTPVAGLYEVVVGANVVYLSREGRYLLQGEMVDLEGNANLTEIRRDQLRQAVLSGMGQDQMIVFSPEVVKHSITVFTDIDCAYCRKLHREMADLNNRGIEVRYLFWPRSGPNTDSWAKAEKVWCSADRNSALTLAKAGNPVEGEVCEDTPLVEHYKLGREVGLRGTPAIVTESGRLISGYLPAPQLHAELAKNDKS